MSFLGIWGTFVPGTIWNISERGGGRRGKPDVKKCEIFVFFESLQISIYRLEMTFAHMQSSFKVMKHIFSEFQKYDQKKIRPLPRGHHTGSFNWPATSNPPSINSVTSKSVQKKQDQNFQAAFYGQKRFKRVQKGVFIFSAPIRERIRSNGYVLSSFFKKVGQKKGHFKAFLGK